jgi:hypothetical protein
LTVLPFRGNHSNTRAAFLAGECRESSNHKEVNRDAGRKEDETVRERTQRKQRQRREPGLISGIGEMSQSGEGLFSLQNNGLPGRGNIILSIIPLRKEEREPE